MSLTLFFNCNNDIDRLVIEPYVRVVKTDVTQSISNDGFVIDCSRCCYFSQNHDHPSLHAAFAGNAGTMIVGYARIDKCVT
mmetsp:Transcript_26555/g.81647  ORF Transcript_26555/g.81647 Transcript_26555/m.81647 type:complete len:81 (+) Transcript_26555:1787-2029(+)